MAQEIKQKIVLEGEQQYKNAIKDAQRNLKTLRSELKAETAEMGRNATEQQKAEAKAKSLKKQIAEQEKIVKANRDALEEVRKKYGDNADAVAKYEQKLNDSRTALANMKSELEGVGKGFGDMQKNAGMATVATKSVADSLEKLSGIGDAIAGSIETAFTGMLDIIRGAVTEIWALIADTAAKANNWTDLGDVFGTTAVNIEEMYRAVNAVGGSGKFDSFVNMVNRLSFGGKEKTIAERLGISDANYEDKLEYTMAVIEQLQAFQNSHTRAQTDDLMSEIFGAKKSADVTWILKNWDAILDKRAEYSEKGYLLDDDEVATMNEVQLMLNDIEQKWDSLKAKFATGFGQVTLDIQAEVSRGMDALAAYFNAKTPEEQEAALEEIEKSILGMFEVVAQAIEDGMAMLDEVAKKLQESDNPTAQAIGTILGGLVDALQWITEDNMTHVVSALEILAAFWLVGKGASMASTIAGMVANIKVIQGFSGAGAAESGAQAAASGTGAAAGGGSGLLAGSVPILGAYGIYKSFEWAANRRNFTPEVVRGTEENLEANTNGDEALKEAFVGYIEAERNLQDLFDSGLYDDEKANALIDAVEEAKSALDALEGSAELLQAYSDWRQEHSYGNMDWELPADWWQTQGGNSGNSDGLTSEDAKSMTGAVNRLPNAVSKAVSNIVVKMDGRTVGRLVAPYVSENIATYIR